MYATYYCTVKPQLMRYGNNTVSYLCWAHWKIIVCIFCYTGNKHNYCTTDSKMLRQLCSEGGAVVMISWNKDST